MESDLFIGTLPFPINFTTLSIGLVILIAVIAFLRGVIGMFVGLACILFCVILQSFSFWDLCVLFC